MSNTPDRRCYDRAQELVATGVWDVDLAQGRILSRSRNGEPIGHLNRMSERRGYTQVTVWLDGRGRNVQAHRVIWESVHGPIPDGLVVNHKNGKPSDNRLVNLEVVTHLENVRHAIVVLGRKSTGRPSGNPKVFADDVRAIRAALAEGCTVRAVASRFGISKSQVSRIGRGERWAHVGD